MSYDYPLKMEDGNIPSKNLEMVEVECDNPISLDEIEKNLWLGRFFSVSTSFERKNHCELSQ